MKQGLIQVYTGEGKGKTTAAFGLAVRAAGAGLRVYIAQFMKHGHYSELTGVERLSSHITIVQFGRERFIKEKATSEDSACAEKGFDAVRAVISEGTYDVVICDELNVAMHYQLIDESRVLQLFQDKPAHVELVLTGRYATSAVIENADLVTEMKPIKHYFEQGIPARVGIEK